MNGRSARNRKLVLDPPHDRVDAVVGAEAGGEAMAAAALGLGDAAHVDLSERPQAHTDSAVGLLFEDARDLGLGDRKSTRLNSSHVRISYAVFCLKKKK